MVNARISLQAARNPAIRELPRGPGEDNVAWIQRALGSSDAPQLLLLGGTSLVDFRLRVAQGHVRHDLKPSFWSHVALLLPDDRRLWHVDLDLEMPLSAVPGANAIAESTLERFADARRFPNLALLHFPGPGADVATLREGIEALQISRLVEDLVSPLVRWLGFVWGAAGAGNPLLADEPLPAAQFVDAAYAYAQVDLVPGLSSRAACPEAIWQAALWWSRYYGGEHADGDHPAANASAIPSGAFCLGQRSAHVLGDD